jgi:hypothetical protein
MGKRACFMCDGTGQTCNICGESEAVCQCENEGASGAPDFRDCDDCKGTGIASADQDEE